MKITDLDTKNVQVTRTETRYILNEKVFELDSCPDWAQWAAVDEDGAAYFYMYRPSPGVNRYRCTDAESPCILIHTGGLLFDPTADWQHSLIKRPERKVLEVTMADLEKKFGCKVKIVKEN